MAKPNDERCSDDKLQHDDPLVESGDIAPRRPPAFRVRRRGGNTRIFSLAEEPPGAPWSGAHLPGPGVVLSPGPSFDAERFQQGIIDRLDGNCIGYSWAICVGGLLVFDGGRGERRMLADGGSLPHREFHRMHIASVAKNLNATVAMMTLADAGLSADTPIIDYLPTLWDRDPSFADIHFGHLMRHRSGIGPLFGANTRYSDLRSAVEGLNVTPGVDLQYDNRNFGLLRILLPYVAFPELMARAEWRGAAQQDYDRAVDQATSNLFVDLANAKLFNRIGQLISCFPNAADNTRTRFYNFPGDGQPGQDGGDWTTRAGGAGWVMSARDLAKYLVYRRYSDVFLTDDERDEMDNNRYGWLTTTGARGTYLRHGGTFTVSGPLEACIMQYPDPVEAAVLVNSNIAPATLRLQNIMRDAYDDAWQ